MKKLKFLFRRIILISVFFSGYVGAVILDENGNPYRQEQIPSSKVSIPTLREVISSISQTSKGASRLTMGLISIAGSACQVQMDQEKLTLIFSRSTPMETNDPRVTKVSVLIPQEELIYSSQEEPTRKYFHVSKPSKEAFTCPKPQSLTEETQVNIFGKEKQIQFYHYLACGDQVLNPHSSVVLVCQFR